jgi:hypothetical protein
MITRVATIDDWDKLNIFFLKIYRENHPLHNKEFWEWQYGNEQFGRSFICLNENEEVTGHVGANFEGGLAWIINVYLEQECRGQGVLGKLYDLARKYYPLAATAANDAGLGLYKNMRWIRYYDLVRYVKINPSIKILKTDSLCRNITIDTKQLRVMDTHYFKQPGIKGLLLADGSRAVSQEKVGGLRVLCIENIQSLENEAWKLGYLWMDYITSWNDLKTKDLDKNGWVLDFKSVIPWRLDPIEENYFCDITFLSEAPLDSEFVVRRSYSDHGRVGSI